MSSPVERDAHHYPPTTAQWATSPLLDHEELERNPLEPVSPAVKPSVRFAASLIILTGVLALAGPTLQFYLSNVASFSGWSLFWTFALTTIVLPMVIMILAVGGVVRGITLRSRVTRRRVVQELQFAAAGVLLQLLNIALPFLHVAMVPSRVGQSMGTVLGLANWLSVASFLIMLASAWFIRIVARPPGTEEDGNDEARFQHLQDLRQTYTRQVADVSTSTWR